MDYTAIIDLIVKILAIIVTGYIVPKLKAYLSAKLTAEQIAELDRLIRIFVEAAEQTVRTSGIDRKAYVVEQLKALNYEIKAEVDARIEAAVYGLNNG